MPIILGHSNGTVHSVLILLILSIHVHPSCGPRMPERVW
jgi:hypothetical protein